MDFLSIKTIVVEPGSDTYFVLSSRDESLEHAIELRMGMDNVSKRHLSDQRADNSPMQPMSLQHNKKILHPETGFS